MAVVNFIEFFSTLSEAMTERTSPQIDLYEVRGVQLLPNNTYPYIQTTNVSGGINLEDWDAFIVNTWDDSETDVTAYFAVDSVFVDADGFNQFNWSLTNVPFDFGSKMVYLKVSQLIGETFYSNMFQLTQTKSVRTTRIDYRNTATATMQSIQLKMWYWQDLKNQEATTYYETSTKNTVSVVVKSQLYERWITEPMSNSLFIKLSNVFEKKYVYLNLVRYNLFEGFEIKEHSGKQNFAQNIMKLAFNSSDTYDPLNPTVVTPLYPQIVLTDVVANGIEAIYTFTYADFAPTYFTYQTSQDQITWSSNNAGVTSPESITFNGTGTWYFRMSHPEAISNIITLELGGIVEAVNDNVNVVKGATKDVNVLFNDTLVGTTTITAVTVPTNGTATIIDAGTKVRYVHNDTATTSDSFDYTIGNGITSDTATVNVTIILSGVSSTGFAISTSGNANAETSCGFLLDTTRYHNGTNAQPTLGDFVYTDSSMLTAFNGANKYYPISNGRAIKINSSGQVTDLYICGAGNA
jgi:hypothetical protein